jgi:hypothetical protein
MGAYARWRALAIAEQRLTVRSAAVLGLAAVALRIFGVSRMLRIASRPVSAPTKNVIGDVVIAVERAGRYVPGATCLTRSLALAWMLRGSGVAAEVRIGVKTAGGFGAHAWVENGGVALNDPQRPAERYAAFVDGL